jgi:hypothetical protein
VANRPTEQFTAGTNPGDFGEAVTTPGTPSGTYALISMVTSPLTVGNRQDYVVIGFPPANSPIPYPNPPATYRWTVVDSRNNPVTHETDIGVFSETFNWPGPLQVTVELISGWPGTNVLATLTLNQTVDPRRQDVQDWITANKADRGDAIHELVSDLRPYINAAVVAQGPNSVPAKLVVGVLWQEMMMRWREGTDGAERYRKALAERKPVTGPEKSTLEAIFGPDDDLVREVELGVGAWAFNAAAIIGPAGGIGYIHTEVAGPQLAGMSLGLGQIRSYIAAMNLCEVEWREKPPQAPKGANAAQRNAIEEQIKSDYNNLPYGKRKEIYNRLRFPKAAVALVTKTLTNLKNRPRTGTTCGPTTTKRWPQLTRQQMVTHERACSIVALEYNIGALDVDEDKVKIVGDVGVDPRRSRYGEWVWRYMANELPINLPAFFPEPP